MNHLVTYDVYNLKQQNEGIRTTLANLLISAGISAAVLIPPFFLSKMVDIHRSSKAAQRDQSFEVDKYNKLINRHMTAEFKELTNMDIKNFKEAFIERIVKDDALLNKKFIIDSIKNCRIFIVPTSIPELNRIGVDGFYTNITAYKVDKKGLPNRFIVVFKDTNNIYGKEWDVMFHEMSHYIDNIMLSSENDFYSDKVVLDLLDKKVVKFDESGKIVGVDKRQIAEKLKLFGFKDPEMISEYSDYYSKSWEYYTIPSEIFARYQVFKQMLSYSADFREAIKEGPLDVLQLITRTGPDYHISYRNQSVQFWIFMDLSRYKDIDSKM